MVSPHLIVDLAFCVGFVAVFYPARKILGRLLFSSSESIGQHVQQSRKLERRLATTLKELPQKAHEVDQAVELILDRAERQYASIVENSKRDMEAMINAQIGTAMERLASQIDCFAKSLRVVAVDVAAEASKTLLREDAATGKRDGEANNNISLEHGDNVGKLH